jgi:pimeloyl-ACP methyl ester carboxylesterase
MFSFSTLTITGYNDVPVPHTFVRQEAEAQRVAILLPGVGYTAHMPLLYYPMRLLLTLGADVLRVEYEYNRREGYASLSFGERVRWLLADATAACRAALAQRPYQQVTLVGKSLGTLAMGHLLTSEPALAQAQAIWLTPLLGNERLRAQVQQARPRSLFAVGTADPYCDLTHLAEIQQITGGETVVIEGADHSLEIEGDVMQSLQAVEQVMRAVQAFLAGS